LQVDEIVNIQSSIAYSGRDESAEAEQQKNVGNNNKGKQKQPNDWGRTKFRTLKLSMTDVRIDLNVLSC